MPYRADRADTDSATALPGEKRGNASQMDTFTEDVRIPRDLKHLYYWAPYLRKYIYDYSMLLDDPQAVSTNYVLRNQYVTLSNILARNPELQFQPRQKVDIPQTAGMPVLTNADLQRFADTGANVMNFFLGDMDYTVQLAGMTQDALTVPVAWSKLRWLQDPGRDPIGARFGQSVMEQIARLKMLRREKREGVFDEHSARHQMMQDIDKAIRHQIRTKVEDSIRLEPPTMVLDPLTNEMLVDPTDPRVQELERLESGAPISEDDLPDVPYFQGFGFDQIYMEDLRYDWSITRPEDIYRARWMAQRSWMTCEQIKAEYNVGSDYFTGIDAGGSSRSTDDTASTQKDSNDKEDEYRERFTADLESSMLGERYAVWERWDKEQGLVYVYVEGARDYLAKYVPTATSRQWFPFFMLNFNRVTGRMIGVSDTMLQMHQQDEVNEKRTRQREAIDHVQPRYVTVAGLFSPREKAQFRTARAYDIIETRRPEIANMISEFGPMRYDPRLYEIGTPLAEMQMMTGISPSALGATGEASFATSDAIASQQLGQQVAMRAIAIERFTRDIGRAMFEISLQALPEENVRTIAGPGAIWPVLDREHVYRELDINVRAGSSGQPDAEKNLQLWMNFANVATQLQLPFDGNEVLKEILKGMDLPVVLERFIPNLPPELKEQIDTMRIMTMLQSGGAANPDGGGTLQPLHGKGATPQGGAPSFSQPRSPDNLPTAATGTTA